MFKRAMHRVIPNSEKERISVAMFFMSENENNLDRPNELINDTTPW